MNSGRFPLIPRRYHPRLRILLLIVALIGLTAAVGGRDWPVAAGFAAVLLATVVLVFRDRLRTKGSEDAASEP